MLLSGPDRRPRRSITPSRVRGNTDLTRRAIGADLKTLRDEIIADKQGFADRKIADLERQISILPIRRASSGNISMRTHLIRLKSSIEKDPTSYADNQLMLIEAAIAEAEAVNDGN